LAICTTGIAGPTGGTEEKPVGLIYVGVLYKEKIFVKEYRLNSKISRKDMKEQFANCALEFALSIL
jgi:nicotinamide mononucleotide (NMN) deamidase PncC